MARWLDPAAISSSDAPIFVDTHVHLDEPAFDRDRDEVIARAELAGVHGFINIGYRPGRWPSTIAVASNRQNVSFTLGVHPQHADEWNDEIAAALAQTAESAGAVAIGEIGLDYFRDGPAPELQRQVFQAQLAIARALHLPVVIHQRAAEADLITVLERDAGELTVVLHSFDGTEALAHLARAHDYYVGVGGLMTRAKSAPLRDLLQTMPRDRLLLETDSPYLVPTGIKARRNEPSQIPIIATRLAEVLDWPVNDLATQTTRNAQSAFNRSLIVDTTPNGARCSP